MDHELTGQSLGKREREVCALVALGKPNKEIAYLMHLTDGTVKQYVSRAFHKTGASNRVALALWWIANRLEPNEVNHPGFAAGLLSVRTASR